VGDDHDTERGVVFPSGIDVSVKDPDLIIIDESGVPQRADSEPEWWIANSLTKYKLEFKYQTSRRGGRSAPGGIIVDFIVYAGLTTALEYAGPYWHTGHKATGEALKWSFLAREFDRFIVFSSEPIPLLGVWVASDLVIDQESSDLAVQKHFK
jgi:hypothetical protein